MSLRYEPSYRMSEWTPLARTLGGQPSTTERLEMRAFAEAFDGIQVMPKSAFHGSWSGMSDEASLSDLFCADLVHERWPALHARPAEIFTAYSSAVADPDKMAELSLAIFGRRAPSTGARDGATMQCAPAGVQPTAINPASTHSLPDDEPTSNSFGWCHQCKRKAQIRRCEHSQPIDVMRDGLTALETVQCRRGFCLFCLDKYPSEDPAEPLFREGRLRCPSCRGLCTCTSCLRTRAGMAARNYKTGPKKQQPASKSSAPKQLAAGACTQRCDASAPLGLGASAASVAAAAALSRQAVPSAPGAFRKCKASCPGCGYLHRLRIRRVAPDAAPLVPYACARCSHPFHIRLAPAGGAEPDGSCPRALV